MNAKTFGAMSFGGTCARIAAPCVTWMYTSPDRTPLRRASSVRIVSYWLAENGTGIPSAFRPSDIRA